MTNKSLRNKLIKQARKADLAKVLIDKFNYDLKNLGNNQYRDRKHDSLVFKNNMYYWNSKNRSGNSVDFLVNELSISFKEAIEILTDAEFRQQKSSDEPNTQQNFQIPPKANNPNRAFAYLNQTRMIDKTIISHLINTNQIIQTKENNNIAFLVCNENNEIVGAELQGTLDKIKFKGVAKNSNQKYGFNIKFKVNNPNEIKKCFVFESAIDLISFIELYYHDKELQDALLVSLAGLKVNTLRGMLKAFKIDFEGPGSVFICTDNDLASNNFKKVLKESDLIFSEIKVPLDKDLGNDWNDLLKHKKQNKRRM